VNNMQVRWDTVIDLFDRVLLCCVVLCCVVLWCGVLCCVVMCCVVF
jgi:hypothetical protein